MAENNFLTHKNRESGKWIGDAKCQEINVGVVMGVFSFPRSPHIPRLDRDPLASINEHAQTQSGMSQRVDI